jgi:hypothetical protein
LLMENVNGHFKGFTFESQTSFTVFNPLLEIFDQNKPIRLYQIFELPSICFSKITPFVHAFCKLLNSDQTFKTFRTHFEVFSCNCPISLLHNIYREGKRFQKEFEYTKWVIGSRKSTQEQKDKLNNNLQNATQLTKHWATRTPLKSGWTQVSRKGTQFLFTSETRRATLVIKSDNKPLLWTGSDCDDNKQNISVVMCSMLFLSDIYM